MHIDQTDTNQTNTTQTDTSQTDTSQTFRPGEVVYLIMRNPHALDVANVQQAAVVQNPEDPRKLALFMHETYFPLTDEYALFKSETDAEQSYQEAFGSPEEGGFYA